MSTPSIPDVLAASGATVFERGWLSANNVLIQGAGPTTLVDSGYHSHATQTIGLLQQALHCTPLNLLLNTHLHSDHCGGNAALQHHYACLKTLIPPGQASSVDQWDPVALTYEPTGQECPAFTRQGLLHPGTDIRLGSFMWEIHAAKGHDPHSIVLFQPEHRLLISADALWQNGFGVVFPELEGIHAFEEVSKTLDVIEALRPQTVIPGHGGVFQDTTEALQRARRRLDQFIKAPDRHHRHAIKVLLKFRLLDWQQISFDTLLDWARTTSYLKKAMAIEAIGETTQKEWLSQYLNELAHSGALRIDGERIINC